MQSHPTIMTSLAASKILLSFDILASDRNYDGAKYLKCRSTKGLAERTNQFSYFLLASQFKMLAP